MLVLVSRGLRRHCFSATSPKGTPSAAKWATAVGRRGFWLVEGARSYGLVPSNTASATGDTSATSPGSSRISRSCVLLLYQVVGGALEAGAIDESFVEGISRNRFNGNGMASVSQILLRHLFPPTPFAHLEQRVGFGDVAATGWRTFGKLADADTSV